MAAANQHVLIFLVNAGPQPYPCHFCGGEVRLILNQGRGGNGQSLTIHHLDEDRKNNAPANLVACHASCHVTHHSTGRPGSRRSGYRRTVEQREAISAGLKRAYAEGRRTRADDYGELGRRGGSVGGKRRAEATNSIRRQCAVHPEVITAPGPLAAHQKWNGCSGWNPVEVVPPKLTR